MRTLVLRLLLFFLLLSQAEHGFAQEKSTRSEREWLINYYFKDQAKFAASVEQIYRKIILGKYDPAKKEIATLKRSNRDPIARAALFTYEANIAYNESRYQESIDLCDSASQLLKSDLTNRYVLKAKNFKAKALGALNEYTTAKLILDTVILISKETGDDFNLAAAYYYYGSFYSDLGDYATCARYVRKSVQLRQKINDEIGLAACYSFLGLCYSHLDDYIRGIEYIRKSIVIRERIGDKRGLANSYLTMYRVYAELGELDKAMESEFKSLEICLELNDLQCVSGRYTNLGQLYQRKGKYKDALDYHFKALKLSKQLTIKNRIAQVHENIARVYSATGKRDQALLHLDSSVVLRKEFGDREGIASAEIVYAEIWLAKGDAKRSLDFSNSAMETASKLKLLSIVKDAHLLQSKAFEQLGKTEAALKHFRSYVELRDSLYSQDRSKELVRQELEFNFKREQEEQRLKQEKKEEQARIESQRQRNIIISASAALVVLSLLLGFSIWQYRLKNRSKMELEISNRSLHEKNAELEVSKEIIEHQHREITDSIRYARQIQHAVLPEHADLKSAFANAFVIFEPKDVISGDFYWVSQHGSQTILATVDCTGHGVPGGFMSMLGVSLLNELVIDQRLNSPAQILSRLREKVISSLRQKGEEGEQKDGMDMTLFAIDSDKDILTYSTANHIFYHVRNSEISEYKGDRHPVGIFGDELLPFNEGQISIQKGDRFYAFTDGYPDQFGGPKGKKFKYQQLKETILLIQDKEMEEQGKILASTFQKWKGTLEQIDDVTLVGIEI
jgi:serine phosphatase RsbU (regulator of sigma subunit)